MCRLFVTRMTLLLFVCFHCYSYAFKYACAVLSVCYSYAFKYACAVLSVCLKDACVVLFVYFQVCLYACAVPSVCFQGCLCGAIRILSSMLVWC